MLTKTTSFNKNESEPGIKGKRMLQEYGEVQKSTGEQIYTTAKEINTSETHSQND